MHIKSFFKKPYESILIYNHVSKTHTEKYLKLIHIKSFFIKYINFGSQIYVNLKN